MCLVPYNRRDCLRGNDGGNEKLGAICVRAGVGHGEETLLGVLELKVLVLELVSVDYRIE